MAASVVWSMLPPAGWRRSAAPADRPIAADTIEVVAARRRSPTPAGRVRRPPLATAPDPLSERRHQADLGAAQVGHRLAMTPYLAAPAPSIRIREKEHDRVLRCCCAPPAATRPLARAGDGERRLGRGISADRSVPPSSPP